jgi:Threonine dehydrogenase and related Zn-dependent dehydrogenases
MKALCWHGANDVRVDNVPDPTIINPRDAIVKITSTAICGSDLHLYDGFIPTMQSGDIMGHEFMGEVVELGSEVKNLKRAIASSFLLLFLAAVASFATAICGRCATTPTPMLGWLKKCSVIRRRDCLATRI